MESPSDDEDSSSNEGDEEDSDRDDEGGGRQDDGSDYVSGAAPGGTGDPIIRVAGSLNFSGPSPWRLA